MRNATTLIATFLAAVAFSFVPAQAQEQGPPQEFIAMAEEALPPEAGEEGTVSSLMEPEVVPQFSSRWDPGNAFEALNDKLTPTQNCFLEREPNSDPDIALEECIYTRGELAGELDASVIKVILGEGTLKYINRGRDADPLGQGVEIPPETAADFVLKLGQALGLPPEEFAREFVQARPLRMTGVSLETQEATKKDMAVHVVVPRCMPVGGTLNRCVPVFDSGLQANVVNDPEGQPLPSWVGAAWKDFRLAAHLEQPLTRNELVNRMATILGERAEVGTISHLGAFISYAQGEALMSLESASQADAQCVPDDLEVEDQGRETQRRAYVPAVVVYAHPSQPDGDINTTDSTGGFQYSVPLIEPSSCEQG